MHLCSAAVYAGAGYSLNDKVVLIMGDLGAGNTAATHEMSSAARVELGLLFSKHRAQRKEARSKVW